MLTIFRTNASKLEKMMIGMNLQDGMERFFVQVHDPRVPVRTQHQLTDILMIALCVTISDCDTYEDIADYGRDKEAFLSTFMELKNSIPSHDTFRRVLSLVKVEEVEAALRQYALR